jgi:hypothetical protein
MAQGVAERRRLAMGSILLARPPGGERMEHRDIQQQVMVEHEILAHVTSALRATLGWHVVGPDFSRKLSSLRFVGESFHRHLKRLMQLEQAEGYMAVVVVERPDLSERVKALRREHVQFRKGARDILLRLKKVEPTDRATFAAISDDLTTLLARLDEHHTKEMDLLQEALLRDEGGEG